MQIVLVRHGKPAGATNPVVGSAGFARWVRHYNKSSVKPDSLPPDHLKDAFAQFFVVSSDLPRAVHSAQLCVGRTPDRTLRDLREMEIPRYRMPLRLSAYSWVYLNRAMWMLGRTGPFESFASAKARAETAADELQRLASIHGQIVAFGHGMMNRHITSRLMRAGWVATSPKGSGYWSAISLEKD